MLQRTHRKKAGRPQCVIWKSMLLKSDTFLLPLCWILSTGAVNWTGSEWSNEWWGVSLEIILSLPARRCIIFLPGPAAIWKSHYGQRVIWINLQLHFFLLPRPWGKLPSFASPAVIGILRGSRWGSPWVCTLSRWRKKKRAYHPLTRHSADITRRTKPPN